jgi:5-methylcytosine-specific restriction endonuclease McrA
MKKKIISKDMVLRAMKHTKSNMSAARYLGCSYPHYKQYAKLYKNEEGQTLFEAHLNRQGRGISKHLYKKKDITPIMDILEGRVNIANYNPKEIKDRLIHESLVKEECHCCEFNERRVVDYKVPLLLNFKDNNKTNWKLENLELLCYNCYFLNVGNVWSDNQLTQMEDYNQKNKFNNDPTPDWEMDEAHKEHLKSLGLWEEDSYDGSEYISKL